MTETFIRIHRNDKDVGYFTLDTARQGLRSGVLRTDDWAFCEGLSDWTPLAVLLEHSHISSTPPPLVQSPPGIRRPPPIPLPKYQPRAGRRLPAIVIILIAAAALVFVFVAVILSATAEPKIAVSAEGFGGRWPLTVSNGFIIKRERYIPNSSFKSYSVIFESPDGNRYGLNGQALSEGYRDIHAITKSRLVFGEPLYEDVSELISIGLDGKR